MTALTIPEDVVMDTTPSSIHAGWHDHPKWLLKMCDLLYHHSSTRALSDIDVACPGIPQGTFHITGCNDTVLRMQLGTVAVASPQSSPRQGQQ
jgi:hypothetical protein